MSLLKCLLWLILITQRVKGLGLQLNPMQMLSSGFNYTEAFNILKGLLEVEQFGALTAFLKHPAYDFNQIYEEVCEHLTLNDVKKVVSTVEFEDASLILSARCICNAHLVWHQIEPEEVKLLPVSPMANMEFNPFAFRSNILWAIYVHAFSIFPDSRRKPINFHAWLTANGNRFFTTSPVPARLLLSAMNGIMFTGATHTNQFLIVNTYTEHIDELIKEAKSNWKSPGFWIHLLKLVIGLKSIYFSDPLSQFSVLICSVLENLYRITQLCMTYERNITDVFGIKVIEAIKSLDFGQKDPAKLSEIMTVLLESGEQLHPDLLVGLLMCKLNASDDDVRDVIVLISQLNPHYATIEIIETLLAHEKYITVSRSVREIFSEHVLLENPDNSGHRPLQRKFKDLRTQHLKFPREARVVLIAGFLGAPREPQELFRDVMNGLNENYYDYKKDVTSLCIASFTRFGTISRANTDMFLSKALNAFLRLPEFFTVTGSGDKHDPRLTIIPSPILPCKYVQILLTLLVQSALMGFSVPFKLDRNFLKYSLKAKENDLSDLFLSHSFDFELYYSKVSYVLRSNSWWLNDEEYMTKIIDNYELISHLSDFTDDLVVNVPPLSKSWLQKSFLDISRTIRGVIRHVFPIFQFNSDEVYYILFDK